MAQISFYHLSQTNLEEALPKLLEKVLETNGKAIVRCGDEAKVKLIDGLLWSVGGKRFIPHATANDNDVEHNHVFITETNDNPIEANFLVDLRFDGDEHYKDFARTLLIFNGAADSEISYARSQWKKLKADPANELKYFLQNEKGIWEQKND